MSDDLALARAGDDAAFARLTEPYRRALRLHCYRLLGSLSDAEDLVQETMLRAWRKLDTFEARAPFRAWLYKIATHACLDELDRRPARVLPQAHQPAADRSGKLDAAIHDPIWLEPCPDSWIVEPEGPEARYSGRESVALAFLAALQLLPPRQRAALILKDVLGNEAAEVAELLELTVPAVNSALTRARKTLGEPRPEAREERLDASLAKLVARYVAAWESADLSALISLLKEDVEVAMPPVPTWFRGRATVQEFFGSVVFQDAGPNWMRVIPISAGGQQGVAVYKVSPDDPSNYLAHGIQVLDFRDGLISGVTAFFDHDLLARFDLPLSFPRAV